MVVDGCVPTAGLGLFANTKTTEYHAEQIIRAKFTRNRIELLLREAQFFGEQIQFFVLNQRVCVGTL